MSKNEPRRTPLISVITVCYQSADTLGDALDSLRNQTSQYFESIVIDGGSTDGTKRIVEEFHDVVTYFSSEKDDGIYDAMNKGLAIAKGDYIAFLNSDDAYFPNTIAEVLDFAQTNNPDVIYGDIIKERKFGKEVFTRLEKPNLSQMQSTMGVFHPSAFAKKSLFETHGGFDLRFKLAADYHWFLKVYLAEVRFEYLEKPLAKFRVGGASNLSCESYREAAIIQKELGIEGFEKMNDLHALCLQKQKRLRLIAKFANLPIFKQVYTNRLKKRWK